MDNNPDVGIPEKSIFSAVSKGKQLKKGANSGHKRLIEYLFHQVPKYAADHALRPEDAKKFQELQDRAQQMAGDLSELDGELEVILERIKLSAPGSDEEAKYVKKLNKTC